MGNSPITRSPNSDLQKALEQKKNKLVPLQIKQFNTPTPVIKRERNESHGKDTCRNLL